MPYHLGLHLDLDKSTNLTEEYEWVSLLDRDGVCVSEIDSIVQVNNV